MKNLLLFSMLIFSATSCIKSQVRKNDLSRGGFVKTSSAEEQIKRSQFLYEIGEIEAAISHLRLWIDNSPYDPSHDLAYQLAIEWLLQIKKPKEAKRLASYFLKHHPKSPYAEKIIELFELAKKEPRTQDEYVFEKKPLEKLLELEEAVNNASSNKNKKLTILSEYAYHDAPFSMAKNIVKNDKPRLSLGFFQARLASYYFHLGDLNKSNQLLSKALKEIPNGFNKKLLALKQSLDEKTSSDKRAFGIVLPLSGPFENFGKNALLGISIGLEIPLDTGQQAVSYFYKNGIKIVVADSKGNLQGTRAAVDHLVEKDRVSLIIGDIINEPSIFLAQVCEQYNVPLLSLSRHPLISDLGENIFIFNSSMKDEVNALVSYAIDNKKHKRFAILFPRHNYGMTMSKLFFDAVIKRGGIVSALENYDAHETTYFKPVKKLLGKFFPDAHPAYQACVQAHRKNQTSIKECRKSLTPIVDFDALFIPEFHKLAFVIPTLIQEDLLVTNNPQAIKRFSVTTKIANPNFVQLLGLGSWNNKNTIEKLAPQISGAHFIDSINLDDYDLKNFADLFLSITNYPITSLEIYAHDAAKLAFTVLNESGQQKTRNEIRKTIANFDRKIGLLKKISFKENRQLNVFFANFNIDDGKLNAI